jgi:oxygen-independent coproporphyrinogen-3 oxidase
LIYWRMGDYIGIGPGAHGRLTLGADRWATEAPRAPGEWLTRVEAGHAAELPRAAVDNADQATEYLLMSLRLTEGMSVSRYEALAGKALDGTKIAQLGDMGLVRLEAGRLIATDDGRMVLNGVLRELAA